MIERIDFTKLPAMIRWYGFAKYFWDTTLVNAQRDSSENKWRGFVIGGDRFRLPLGCGDSSFAKMWTPGKKPRNDEKGKFENGPDDIEDDIK